MNDTHWFVEKVYREKLMRLSGEQRLLRGIRMFETCREMALASLGPEIKEQERRAFLLERFYGKELTDKRRTEFLTQCRQADLKSEPQGTKGNIKIPNNNIKIINK